MNKVERPQISPKTKMEKSIIYYCNKGMPTFHIPEYERDEIGEVVTKNGKPVQMVIRDVDGNNPRKVEKKITFDRLPIIDPKTKKVDASRRIGIFILSPDKGELWERREEIVKFLENAKKTALNGIMTEAEFKKSENALAFSLAQDNENLKTQLEEANRRISELEEQVTNPKR